MVEKAQMTYHISDISLCTNAAAVGHLLLTKLHNKNCIIIITKKQGSV